MLPNGVQCSEFNDNISVLITLTFLMHCLDLGGIPFAGQDIS